MSEPNGVPTFVPRPDIHPGTPKSSARRGAKRFPPGVTQLLNPALKRAELTSLMSTVDLDVLAGRAEVITVRDGRVDCSPVALGAAAEWRWSDLWAIRRIGTYRGAPNRIGMYVVEQDGYRRMIEAESWLEMSHLRDLEFNAGVTWLLTQPFALRWPVDQHCMWRVPDILLRDANGWSVADVKPEDSRTEFTELMFELTRQTLTRVGLEYRVLGEMSRQKKRNLRALSYQRWSVTALEEPLARARQARRRSWQGVVDSAGGGSVGRAAALHLATREMSLDLDLPITAGTAVQWSEAT